MINILRKIIYTGIVTEEYDEGQPPARFRGEVVINNKACKGCQGCAEVCPTRAIEIIGKEMRIHHKACIFCGRCVQHCELQQITHTDRYKLATMLDSEAANTGKLLKERIKSIFDRSLHIRHVDVGSCNACDFEMSALTNPIYDVQQYGIDFVASPRHADMLMVTGVVTRNLTQALLMTYEAVPAPKLVMAVGACAASGQVLGSPYAVRGAVDELVPVDIYVPGCPPRPQALLYGLLTAMNKL
ncbi:MAG: NADH-quinone oxidoreductase subunit NuoB [Sporomusaceae bacterium]|nr:NADH-quinone oxidoreductase subunit NuoB [Sporomusaceae bacterium]